MYANTFGKDVVTSEWRNLLFASVQRLSKSTCDRPVHVHFVHASSAVTVSRWAGCVWRSSCKNMFHVSVQFHIESARSNSVIEFFWLTLSFSNARFFEWKFSWHWGIAWTQTLTNTKLATFIHIHIQISHPKKQWLQTDRQSNGVGMGQWWLMVGSKCMQRWPVHVGQWPTPAKLSLFQDQFDCQKLH